MRRFKRFDLTFHAALDLGAYLLGSLARYGREREFRDVLVAGKLAAEHGALAHAQRILEFHRVRLPQRDADFVARNLDAIRDVDLRRGGRVPVMRDGKIPGCVVLETGKRGAVLREENRDSLRQNGIIIYLRRSVDELSGEGRPLSSSREKIQKLYEERRAVYESFADYTVDVSEDIGTTAKRILECVSL